MDEAKLIFAYVTRRVNELIRNRESGPGKAELARLRRGIGKVPGELPELWGSFLLELPDALMGKGREPSYAEWAIYTSLTVFSLHQQGNTEPMHQEEVSFGEAVRGLIGFNCDAGEEERILRRLRPIITASDMEELSYHLRSMVELLRQKGIPLDYGRMAKDLYYFQYPAGRKSVQLSWGRDFYRKTQDKERDEEE